MGCNTASIKKCCKQQFYKLPFCIYFILYQILGAGLLQSDVLSGMIFKREVEGDITSAQKAKIAIYSCPIDITQTETKGTVLIKSADELLDFSRGEESLLEKQIKDIAATGVKVIVAGAKFGDMALHFLNKYEIMAVRLNSKFDLRRVAKTVNGTVSIFYCHFLIIKLLDRCSYKASVEVMFILAAHIK